MSRALVCIVALALAPSTLGCSKNPKHELQGKWVGDRVEQFPAAQASRAEGWVAGTSFAFKGSHVTIAVPAESPREGTFEVSKVKDGTMTLAFVRPDASRDTAEFRLEADGHLRWQLGDGRSILLRKAEN